MGRLRRLVRQWPLPKVDTNVILVVAFSLFAWAPLLTPVYFLKAHDAAHSVFFLTEFHQGIQDGYLYPRWGPDHCLGYGYPTFIFYYFFFL